MPPTERIHQLVQFLYPQHADEVIDQLLGILDEFSRQHPHLSLNTRATSLTERDAILITYGDQFQAPGQPPLQTLAQFLKAHLADVISSVHVLPFYPYSSDDGFSVIDYRQVDPALGTWEDISRMGQSFRLMFDAVINHISRGSNWFQRFLGGEPQVEDDFIIIPPGTNLSQVTRPRTLPLLTTVDTARGQVSVWTTFSDDQIDLNYANPRVLLEIIDLLLFYVARGASIIRLDAIAYLWKVPGTTCIHLPQTHAVVKLFRTVLDAVAPGVLLITETNVPHAENISYFGELLPETGQTDEAQLVYDFPLAPLILHTFQTGSARALQDWAKSLAPPPPGAYFFNFLASHDGIGVRPAEGLLSPQQVQALVDKTLAHGGQVAYKTNPDGTQSPYELNITWFDALNDPNAPDPAVDVQRFLASQAIMLSLAGVPGIYIHSLFGSRNCPKCYAETGRARSLNREKFSFQDVEAALADPDSRQAQVFFAYRSLLEIRKEQPAFHPQGEQRVMLGGEEVFGVIRRSPDREETMLCLVEVAGRPHSLQVDLSAEGLPLGSWDEIAAGLPVSRMGDTLDISLGAYGIAWLKWAGETKRVTPSEQYSRRSGA